MQLTKYTDISLRVLMHLALNPEKRATITEISDIYNVSRNHLLKVVHQLAIQGYIVSTQGRGGGISLANGTENVTVGEIVREMEQSLELIDCEGSGCPLTPSCNLKRALNEAMNAFLSKLDDYTIADLVSNRRQLLRLIG